MSASLPDKRILKAFYTQYISVLLIILVFTVGSASGTREKTSKQEATYQEEKVALGAISIPGGVDASGTLSPDAVSALEAVSKVLLNHDVTATVRVPVGSHHDSDGRSHIENALTHSHKFRAFLLERGVPVAAVKSVIARDTKETGVASISFSPSEGVDEN